MTLPADVADTQALGAPAHVVAMSEVLPDGLVVVDGGGVVRYANSRAGRILGMDERQLFGRAVQDGLPLRDSDGRSWWDLADPWRTLHIVKGHREKLLWTATGAEVLITAKYIREGRRGPVERVLMSVRDAKARQRAEQDHAALISTIAHELRSPLTSVKGFSTTLLRRWDKFTDEQKRFMIETIEIDADRVTRLITELLDVSRIDAGRLDVRTQPVDLEALARRHIERIETASPVEVRIVVECDPELPEVWADPDRIQQILGNLLENGIRHGAGTVTLQIRADTGEVASGRPAIVVIVSDEGDGVPEEHLPLIFNRFWHGSKRGSTGLGLYIVRGLVEAHGGRISVGRTAGGAAEFRVVLPTGAPEHLQ
ncbi:sensor histidine kinase [Lapillicoccus sp.]|uniref:sensor histidine kinase n=1 Tax=Lapillicoccus sp. TaxID=1909287 RepID=UPI0039837681